MFAVALLVPSKGRLAAIRFYSLSRKKAASAGGTQTQDPSLLNTDKNGPSGGLQTPEVPF